MGIIPAGFKVGKIVLILFSVSENVIVAPREKPVMAVGIKMCVLAPSALMAASVKRGGVSMTTISKSALILGEANLRASICRRSRSPFWPSTICFTNNLSSTSAK